MKPARVTVAFRLSPGLLERVDAVKVKSMGLSAKRSDRIRLLVAYALRKLESANERRQTKTKSVV